MMHASLKLAIDAESCFEKFIYLYSQSVASSIIFQVAMYSLNHYS